MPELPEVETTRLGIAPHLVGQVINHVVVRNPKLRWPVPTQLTAILSGQPLIALRRRGKYLIFYFAHGQILLHLGMSGHLRLLPCHHPPQKHDHVDFIFEQQLLRFTDPRRFGCILWTQADLAHPLLAHLGVEPLTQAFNAKTLHQLAKRRQVPIKTLIMDPKVVVGVGNIYATESCYQAQINPWLPAQQATLANYQVLVPAIKKILRQAIKVGGTTLKDFQNVQGKPGHFKTQLQVYGRQGQPCHRCQTIIQAQVMQQRNTSFCPLCQA